MKNDYRKPVALFAAAVLVSACGSGAPSTEKAVAAGDNWDVAATTRLSQLTIGEGASITAPAGHDLTMTVDGVETPIASGTYTGDIVLTPAESIIEDYAGMGTEQEYHYRAAVYVNDGAYQPGQSVEAAVTAGSVSDTVAEGVAIQSVGDEFMGIVIDGNSPYRIDRPKIYLQGNGVNDFNGFGAAIRIDGSSKITVEAADIKNKGVVRTGIWVGGDAEAVVNNATIEVSDGVLPADYGWSWVNGGGGDSGDVMMEVPWMLGIVGNNRATLVVGNGIVHYNDSYIKAQRWGAMSTDAVQEVELYVNDSHVEVVESGYGGYADGNSLVSFSGSTVDVPDYGLIMSGGSGVITDGTIVISGANAVMSHGGPRGTLTIDKGSVLTTSKAVIQLKGASPSILVDGAELKSANGIILQAMANDDPNRRGPGGPPPGPDGAAPGGEAGGAPPGAPPRMGGKYSVTDGDNNIDARFRNVVLNGDFLNSMPGQCGMNLVFESAQLTGAISTAIPEHAIGPNGEEIVIQESTELYYLIGEQTETLAATEDADGANVALDGNSSWTVNRTSYLTGLSLAAGATLNAPGGRDLVLTVDGQETAIGAGTYKGAIVLRVE